MRKKHAKKNGFKLRENMWKVVVRFSADEKDSIELTFYSGWQTAFAEQTKRCIYSASLTFGRRQTAHRCDCVDNIDWPSPPPTHCHRFRLHDQCLKFSAKYQEIYWCHSSVNSYSRMVCSSLFVNVHNNNGHLLWVSSELYSRCVVRRKWPNSIGPLYALFWCDCRKSFFRALIASRLLALLFSSLTSI